MFFGDRSEVPAVLAKPAVVADDKVFSVCNSFNSFNQELPVALKNNNLTNFQRKIYFQNQNIIAAFETWEHTAVRNAEAGDWEHLKRSV